MADAAEDLQIVWRVRSAERARNDVIKIPELARRDSSLARLAMTFGFEEEIKACLCGETEAGHGAISV